MKHEAFSTAASMRAFQSAWTRRSATLWLLAVAAPMMFLIPITHDEIWHIWIAERMLHGARLYRDIIEVNPPLWFWMGLPLAASGLSARTAIVAFIVASMLVSLLLTPPKLRPLSLVAMAIIPLHDFGQREHFTLIATIPYVLAASARRNDEPVRAPIVIGIFAAFGLALKPYFTLVPLALEFTVRRHIRPETVALTVCACLYAIAVPTITPEYLTNVVPILRAAYGAFGGGPGVALTIFAFAFAFAGALVGKRTGDATTRALFIAACAFAVGAVAQGKGWSYQSLPARGFLFMAIAVELFRRRKAPIPDALLLGAALSAVLPLGLYSNDFRSQIDRHLAGVPPGASIVVIANNPSVSWPMVYDHNLRWTLPEMSTWQIQALKQSPQLLPLAKRLANVGLAQHPDIVLIDLDPHYRPYTLQLLPPHYLDNYTPRLRTARFISFTRTEAVQEWKK